MEAQLFPPPDAVPPFPELQLVQELPPEFLDEVLVVVESRHARQCVADGMGNDLDVFEAKDPGAAPAAARNTMSSTMGSRKANAWVQNMMGANVL